MTRRVRGPVVCARCDRHRMHASRGLCASCYEIVRRSSKETLDDYPRVTWDAESLVSDATFLADRYPRWTKREVAERLGVTYDAVWVAESRTRKRAAA